MLVTVQEFRNERNERKLNYYTTQVVVIKSCGNTVFYRRMHLREIHIIYYNMGYVGMTLIIL